MHDTEMTVMKKDKCLFSLGGTFFSQLNGSIIATFSIRRSDLYRMFIKAEKCQEIPLD